jgi:hypothetical protein
VPQFTKLATSRSSACHAAGRRHIAKLPKAEHMTTEWQSAMKALILVATLGAPMMFARVGVMKGLNRHVEHVFGASRKGL